MGIRLEGTAVAHKTKANIISDAAVIGSIQIPADGKPIILMADRQTTGGYAKIGTVIKEDIIKLAQIAPKDTVQFRRISMEEAKQKYRAFYQKLEAIRHSLQAVYPAGTPPSAAAAANTVGNTQLCNAGTQPGSTASVENTAAGIQLCNTGMQHYIAASEGNTSAGFPPDTASAIAAVKETISLPVAGTIVNIAVTAGDTVKEGDLLLTFEALKMENDMTAPYAGTVGSIYKAVGNTADTGESVLELIT